VLRPFFPGKTQRCAIEEFSAFLVQLLGGDEAQTQKRWWLSLHQSHARFAIGPADRAAWLRTMAATLDASALDEGARRSLRQFFDHTSAYILGRETAAPEHGELAACWSAQRALDAAVAALDAGRDDEVLAVAPRFRDRPSVYVGLLARMMRAGRAPLIAFVVDSLERDPALIATRWAGRLPIHYAAAAGAVEVLDTLLRLGADPCAEDDGG